MCATAGLLLNVLLPSAFIPSRVLLFVAFPTTMVLSGALLAYNSTTLPVKHSRLWSVEIWSVRRDHTPINVRVHKLKFVFLSRMQEILYMAVWFSLYAVSLAMAGRFGVSEAMASVIMLTYVVDLFYLFIHLHVCGQRHKTLLERRSVRRRRYHHGGPTWSKKIRERREEIAAKRPTRSHYPKQKNYRD